MKFAFIFAAVLAVSAAQSPLAGVLAPLAGFGSQPRLAPRPTLAAPRPAITNRIASNNQAANVLHCDYDANPDGSYNYALAIDNGIAAHAEGTPRHFGGNPPVVAIVSQGSFSWTSPEGQFIIITYVADENGYQPSGDAINTGPKSAAAVGSSGGYSPGATYNALDIRSKLNQKSKQKSTS